MDLHVTEMKNTGCFVWAHRRWLIVPCLILASLACERDVDQELVTEVDEVNITDHEEESDYTWDESGIVTLEFNGTSMATNGEGVTINGSDAVITAAGTYSLSGTLSDGQVTVDTEDEEVVRIIFNGVDLHNSSSSPVYIKNAYKTIIVLTDGSNNFVSDASSYSFDSQNEDEPNAAIFSDDNLTIYGDGSLTVDGNYNDGIDSKDGLIIKSGTITVNVVDDGIRGKDYLLVKGGNISIDAAGDGLKSDNDEDTAAGFITIEGGTIDISSMEDAITAETDVYIYYGDLNLTTGGGSSGSSNSNTSVKGIKSGISTIIDDGSINIDAADDAIHSNGDIIINGGIYTLASGDDAIHADLDVVVNWGDIDIIMAYEGVESAEGNITINDGVINLVTSDDGFNVAAGGDNQGGRQKSTESTTATYLFQINGGYIALDAEGDGLDSNDDFEMTGGKVIVSGSSLTSNSALDVVGTLTVDNGFLVASGSSRMAQAPGTSSDQNSILVTFNSTLAAGTLVHIENQDGEEILNFEPPKSFDSMAFSSPELITGDTYTIYLGGSSSGTPIDWLYQGGTYTPGSHYTSFTISGTVTNVN